MIKLLKIKEKLRDSTLLLNTLNTQFTNILQIFCSLKGGPYIQLKKKRGGRGLLTSAPPLQVFVWTILNFWALFYLYVLHDPFGIMFMADFFFRERLVK